MDKKVECPNCGGTGQDGSIRLNDGTTKPKTCTICCGEGYVPEWDFDRLKKLSFQRNGAQEELKL